MMASRMLRPYCACASCGASGLKKHDVRRGTHRAVAVEREADIHQQPVEGHALWRLPAVAQKLHGITGRVDFVQRYAGDSRMHINFDDVVGLVDQIRLARVAAFDAAERRHAGRIVEQVARSARGRWRRKPRQAAMAATARWLALRSLGVGRDLHLDDAVGIGHRAIARR